MTDNEPLVSIVIPTLNRRRMLERCLRALARQSDSNYEIIVVDDGSTDGTSGLLQRFAEEHPTLSLRWLRNGRQRGANPSRNRGIQAARGRYVAFLDSDCIARQDWLEKLMQGIGDGRVGAATGMVDDTPPHNIYDLAFKGSHRIGAAGPARRLVFGNLCVRRELLLQCPLDEDRAGPAVRGEGGVPDTAVSGRGDEEGLFLMLRAAGIPQVNVPDAVVDHEHHFTANTFFRQAFRGGCSAARLVYKYYLPTRIDILPFLLAYATVPTILLDPDCSIIPAFFFLSAFAAILYNELRRKGKTLKEAMLCFPLLIAYYHFRVTGYVRESLMLRVKGSPIRRIRL